MNRLEELDRLDKIVKECDGRLKTLKTHLDVIEKEIDLLSTIETQLEENVKCLKKSKVIAIALEYKKAKEDLAKTRVHLNHFKETRDAYRKAYGEIERVMKKTVTELQRIHKGSENNVLKGKFGKKNGQK